MKIYSAKSYFQRLLLFIIVISVLFSCVKDKEFPSVENIIKGGKWTIQIGSTAEEVYYQLQILGPEKKFNDVSVVCRKPFSKPEEIQRFLGLYSTLILQNRAGITDRALFHFQENKVKSIEVGSAHLTEVSEWPQNSPENVSILVNERLDLFYEKLKEVYQGSPYKDYQFILPDKSLGLPFDPDMSNYKEWAFTFSYDVRPGKGATSSVRLYFDNGRLKSIRHEYNEADVYN